MDNTSNNPGDQQDRSNSLKKYTWYGSTQPARQKTDEEIKAELALRLRKRGTYQASNVPPPQKPHGDSKDQVASHNPMRYAASAGNISASYHTEEHNGKSILFYSLPLGVSLAFKH